MGDTFYCEKCNKTMNGDQFYSSNNLEKYPNEGKLNLCKKCITLRVDNWDPETYLWFLQEVDVPYVQDEWNKLLAKYGQDRHKTTGMTILGRYLSKMKLKQYKDYRWKDTQHLQDIANKKMEEAMKRQGYDRAQIDEAIAKGSIPIPEGEIIPPDLGSIDVVGQFGYSNGPSYFDEHSAVAEDSLEFDLTEEDKLYLRLKWGKTYRPEEWVALEKLYNEMMESYEITTAGHIDTLKLICKTSLKCNQLIDIGDIEGFQKMSKVYDTLMKSGKFTAAQNKGEAGEYVDSISELVLICEKDGFIPRYYTDGPQDKVDYVIQDLQDYTRTLITEEMHLGALIEKAVNKIEEDRLKELEDEIDDLDEDEAFERELFSKKDEELSYEDFQDFKLFEEEQEAANAELYDEWGAE